VDDALNRRVHEMHVTTISIYMSNLKDTILEATNLDQHYFQIKEAFQQNIFQQKFKDYELKEDGVLMYNEKICVPKFEELKI
jgi:hypothetical protein